MQPIALALLLLHSPEILDVRAKPASIELTRGISVLLRTSEDAFRTVKLIALEERTEPYFESATGSIAQAVVEARALLEIDGKRHWLSGGPFHLPVTLEGLPLLIACTRNWAGGISPDPLKADVRLEIGDAPREALFPVKNYRWRVMNYQHTFLALAVNQARLYYHRGEDFGMIPDLEEALSVTDGEVTVVPGPKGDGRSNGFVVAGSDGLQYRYAHMNAPNIEPALKPGSAVSRGQKLGLTGNTWNGGPVGDPHLHLDLTTSGDGRNYRHSFPMIAAAYVSAYPNELRPVAGGWRHVYAGQEIALDGSKSLPAADGRIVSHEWTFSDGRKASGARQVMKYTAPGTYTEMLTVRDDKGRQASDFVEIFVLSAEQRQPPPYAWINYYPIRGIRPGDEVKFLTRFAHMKEVTIDFGDGHVQPYSLNTVHRYAKPGVFNVTVRGQNSGSGPGVFHVRVFID